MIREELVFMVTRIVAVLLAILFIAFDIFPKSHQILDARERIQVMRKTSRQLTPEDKSALHKKFREELTMLETGFKEMQKLVQARQEKLTGEINGAIATLLIEDLVTSQGIELQFIKPGASGKEGNYEILPIVVGFQAEYAQAVSVVAQLADLAIPVSLRAMTITADPAILSRQNIEMTIYTMSRKVDGKNSDLGTIRKDGGTRVPEYVDP